MAMNIMPIATSDLPDPVGVPRMTLLPAASANRASSWCGQGSMPRASTHSRKRPYASSAVSQGSASSPSVGSHQLGASAPSDPGACASNAPSLAFAFAAAVALAFADEEFSWLMAGLSGMGSPLDRVLFCPLYGDAGTWPAAGVASQKNSVCPCALWAYVWNLAQGCGFGRDRTESGPPRGGGFAKREQPPWQERLFVRVLPHNNLFQEGVRLPIATSIPAF